MYRESIIGFFKDTADSKKKTIDRDKVLVFNLIMLDLIKTARRAAQLEEVNRRFSTVDKDDPELRKYINKYLLKPEDVFEEIDLHMCAKKAYSLFMRHGESLAKQSSILCTRDGRDGTVASGVFEKNLQAVSLEDLIKRLKSSTRFNFYCRVVDRNIDRTKIASFAPILSLKDIEEEFRLEKPRPPKRKFFKFLKILLTRVFI